MTEFLRVLTGPGLQLDPDGVRALCAEAAFEVGARSRSSAARSGAARRRHIGLLGLQRVRGICTRAVVLGERPVAGMLVGPEVAENAMVRLAYAPDAGITRGETEIGGAA